MQNPQTKWKIPDMSTKCNKKWYGHINNRGLKDKEWGNIYASNPDDRDYTSSDKSSSCATGVTVPGTINVVDSGMTAVAIKYFPPLW
jgi:hypothetical protein